LGNSEDLNWESVWDRGFSAADAAEDAPVAGHTDEGLPMRQPGARLVPGGMNGGAHRSGDADDAVASAAESAAGQASPRRDPEAVRATMSSHFGGVRAARSHVQEANRTGNE
jgi:hypothetical protein